jgi:hypothetical protein
MLAVMNKAALIEKIRELPARLEALVSPLTDAQLDAKPPREWTARQNVHHLAESHMNAFIRVKLALTEDHPTIKPYNQDACALTVDAKDLPIESSLSILRGLHIRWVALFESLTPEQWQRTLFHPENGIMTVEDILKIYAAHGEGHLVQITEALRATGNL